MGREGWMARLCDKLDQCRMRWTDINTCGLTGKVKKNDENLESQTMCC